MNNLQTVISRKTPKTKRPVDKRVFFISCSLKKKPIELKKNRKFTLGRSSKNTLRINEGTVSERHAFIKWVGASFRIFDNRSTNGTFVNGRRISGDALLKPGDKIKLGKFVLTFTSRIVREKPAPSPKRKAKRKSGTKRPAARQTRRRPGSGASPVRKKARRPRKRAEAVTHIRF